MIFTTPSGKKSVFHTLGGMCDDKPVIANKGGSAGFLSSIFITTSIHSCSSSVNSNKARLGNKLNTYSRFSKVLDVDFYVSHSPAFDTLLDSNSTKFYRRFNK